MRYGYIKRNDILKVSLINPPHLESLDTKLDPPLGLMYIASVIRNLNKRHNCNDKVSIIDLSFHDKSTWKNVIPIADLYGITVMTSSLHHALFIKDICKNINPNCKVMIGGAHPSSLPRETMNLGFDITVVGESEGIMEEILNYVSDVNSQYPTIIYGNSKLENINKIPLPSRDLVPITQYTRLVNGIFATSIIASRGCPHNCSFCINSTKNLFSKPRFRDVDIIIKEMKELMFKYNFKAFIFYDDTFTIHPKLDYLLEKIKCLKIIFRCNGNARTDTLETFKKLYDAGCREISFGIESGSQRILNIINKNVTVEQNATAINNAKKVGLIVKAFLIVGSPSESWETIKETIRFVRDTCPQLWTLFTFVPLPGCDIYNNPDKYGIKIITKDFSQYFNIAGNNIGGSVCETQYMTSNDIERARQYMIEHLPQQTGKLQLYYKKLNK